jgi:hypothetical protein
VKRRLRSVVVALPLALLAALLVLTGWSWRADRVVYDLGLSLWRRPPPPDIVIVAIDDASVAAIGRWPWPRVVHSTLLERLAEARPRSIALDLVLSEPDTDPAQDLLLARMLRRWCCRWPGRRVGPACPGARSCRCRCCARPCAWAPRRRPWMPMACCATPSCAPAWAISSTRTWRSPCSKPVATPWPPACP